MRLLLIAYEFPPSPSPQSLRWAYFARELDALGHEVHVLAPDFGGETPGLPVLPRGVVVHRCFAGPFRGRRRLPARPCGPDCCTPSSADCFRLAPLRR